RRRVRPADKAGRPAGAGRRPRRGPPGGPGPGRGDRRGDPVAGAHRPDIPARAVEPRRVRPPVRGVRRLPQEHAAHLRAAERRPARPLKEASPMPMPTARNRLAARLKPKLTGAAERSLKAVPFVRAKLEREYAKLIAGMEPGLKPYR